MHFISMVSYSIVVNGRVGERSNPSQALRQGDPLSPYLFLICGEGLSALLRKEESCGTIRGAMVFGVLHVLVIYCLRMIALSLVMLRP